MDVCSGARNSTVFDKVCGRFFSQLRKVLSYETPFRINQYTRGLVGRKQCSGTPAAKQTSITRKISELDQNWGRWCAPMRQSACCHARAGRVAAARRAGPCARRVGSAGRAGPVGVCIDDGDDVGGVGAVGEDTLHVLVPGAHRRVHHILGAGPLAGPALAVVDPPLGQRLQHLRLADKPAVFDEHSTSRGCGEGRVYSKREKAGRAPARPQHAMRRAGRCVVLQQGSSQQQPAVTRNAQRVSTASTGQPGLQPTCSPCGMRRARCRRAACAAGAPGCGCRAPASP